MPIPEEKIVKIIDETVHTRGATVEQMGSQGALVVKDLAGTETSTIPGLGIPPCDYIAVTYPDGNTEVYTYKSGGASGDVVAIITCTYSEGNLVSVVRTES